MPTDQQLQNRLTATGQTAAPTAQPSPIANPFSTEGAARIAQIAGQQPAPISASVLSSPTSFTIPPTQQTPVPDYTKIQVSTPASPIVNTPEQDRLAGERDSLITGVLDANTRMGQRSARRGELETAAGIPVLNTQLNELNTLIRNTQAEAFAATQKSEDRLAPMFAITGEQAQIERQRAVKVYGWAAAAEAIQGNIALAQDNVQRALDAEFGPLEKEIENKKFLLELNMDNFNTEEKRRADLRAEQLDTERAELANRRADKEAANSVMLIAAQYGAPTNVLSSLAAAPDMASAISLAEQYLQDPQAQIQLEIAKLDLLLKSQAYAAGLSGSQPGADPAVDTVEAQQTIDNQQEKITHLNSIISHPGLNSSVGPIKGTRIALTDQFGAKDDFLAAVDQLISKDFLDTLINVKGQGATFGALTDREGAAIRSAASKLEHWAVRDKDTGKIKYFDVSESRFIAEVNRIKTSALKIQEAALKSLVTPADMLAIETYINDGASTGAFNADAFFTNSTPQTI